MPTFGAKVKSRMANIEPRKFTGGMYRGLEYLHIYKPEYMTKNFIDGNIQKNCAAKGSYADDGHREKVIKYHSGGTHMNSSQVMCINFFKKFFERTGWEEIMLECLRESGAKIEKADILRAVFEFVPNFGEKSNIDFYMELADESKIYIEVKYSESSFGSKNKITEEKGSYKEQWNCYHKKMVSESPYLNCSEDEFYKNYQINRNIAYAVRRDIVLFIVPRANNDGGITKGKAYIESFKSDNIKVIYWEDIIEHLMKLIQGIEELETYYNAFKKKYIDILSD